MEETPGGSEVSAPRSLHRQSRPAKRQRAASASQPMSKKSVAEIRRKATELCRGKSVTHTSFQSKHEQSHAPHPNGHWHVFLEGVQDPTKVLTCAVSVTLRHQVLAADVNEEPPQPQDGQIVAAEPDGPASPQGPQVHSKGRPKKGEVRWNLHKHIRETRSTVYVQTDKTFTSRVVYRCLACSRDIAFCSATCEQKITKHENSQAHIKGLERMQMPALPQPEPLPALARHRP